MTMPYVFANGVGNYPDATKFNGNYSYLETMSRRNRIINGNFVINQRLVTSVADDVYNLDRWYALTETGNVTIAQMTDQESGSPTSIKLTQPDASPKRIGLAQIVESNNIRDLNGAYVTLTGRLKCSLSQPIRYSIIGIGSVADSVASDVVNTWSSSNFTANNFFISAANIVGLGSITPSANTWTNFSVTGLLGSEKNAIVFMWTEGTLAQNGTLEFSRISLRQGMDSVYSETYDRTIGEELTLCQRYYEKSYGIGFAPGTIQNNGAVSVRTKGAHLQTVPFKVVKRSSPSFTAYSPSTGASGYWYDSDSTADRAVSVSYAEDSSVIISIPTSVDNHATFGHWVASAEL